MAISLRNTADVSLLCSYVSLWIMAAAQLGRVDTGGVSYLLLYHVQKVLYAWLPQWHLALQAVRGWGRALFHVWTRPEYLIMQYAAMPINGMILMTTRNSAMCRTDFPTSTTGR
jgi:hypothetical protein